MTREEARARLDAWLREAHGLCVHDVVLSSNRCTFIRRRPCEWPACDHPLHQHAFGRRRVRHSVFWAEGADVWLALTEARTRALAAAAMAPDAGRD